MACQGDQQATKNCAKCGHSEVIDTVIDYISSLDYEIKLFHNHK